MNINDQNKYEVIDQFLNQELNPQDLDKFRAFMQSDTDLALDTTIVEELQASSDFAPQAEQLRNSLNKIRQEQATTKHWKLKAVFIAAILAILLYSFFTLIWKGDNNRNTIDIQQFAMVEPLAFTTKSNEAQTLLVDIQNKYNSASYQSAIGLMNTYLIDYPKDLDILLARGIANMELNHFDQALVDFDKITALNPRVPKQLWHKALVYCELGDYNQAKATLNSLIKTKGYNLVKAQNLLSILPE